MGLLKYSTPLIALALAALAGVSYSQSSPMPIKMLCSAGPAWYIEPAVIIQLDTPPYTPEKVSM